MTSSEYTDEPAGSADDAGTTAAAAASSSTAAAELLYVLMAGVPRALSMDNAQLADPELVSVELIMQDTGARFELTVRALPSS